MSEKTSLEYSELTGLGIALSNLLLVPVEYQDQEWLNITGWMKARIKELESK
jgi:hypothetical protein